MKPLFVLLAFFVLAGPAAAQTEPALPQTSPDRSLFVMGGPMGAEGMGGMLIPFNAEYEDAFALGVGYQHFVLEPIKALRLGYEIGGALRVGDKTTGEIWAGATARYDGFVLGDRLGISPGLTFGLSAVTDTMGVEAERQGMNGEPSNLLFYFSPEISFSDVENPGVELFWRVHHRSGAWGTLGGGSSANATMIGVRASF
ncbi:hypothetical protein [Pelagibacterium montanilacus]|uniref:hypothetical protein n=1 Tax=Pelagibacterium montanilacus TaxID=2185280 RepID=UPI000F8DD5D2|nr:hypothetical protein [Pelagibacterium montanilacus]